MKYLKKYKLFESIYMDYDTISDVNDILSELSDDDIPVSVDARIDGNVIVSIGIEYVNTLQATFSFKTKKYEDAFIRLIEYMNPKNYTLIAFNYDDENNMTQTYKDFGMGDFWRYSEETVVLLPKHLMSLDETNFIKLYFKLNKVSESINESKEEIINKEEFPSEYYIRDFFFDLIDDLPYSDVKISNNGYVSLTTDYLYKTELRSQMLYDMSFEDDWLNTEIKLIQDTWKNIILPIESFDRHDYYPFYIDIDSSGSNFEDKFYENIINGNIPAYPIIELERIYFNNDKEKINLLSDCLLRLYEVTGFRPIGDFHTEDFVDEENGEVVTLYIANIKLLKITDVEYKSFIKSSVFVNNPRMEENIEMTKKFF